MNESTFESYRPLMFAIAYRMLGSAMDAEDIVQEAYLRVQTAEQVAAPKALLSTVVTRLCLDQLKSAREQRETYFGSWLPEPLITPPGEGQYESISLAFLVLLESLSPVERAVFLLREVFDYDYREISQMVGKEEAACRQLFHRAKGYIAQHRPRFEATAQEHQAMLEQFMQACMLGELDGLTDLLSEDISLVSDGGGKASAATRPLHGRDPVARFWLGLMKRYPENYSIEFPQVNGRMALLIRDEHRAPSSLVTFEMDAGKIRAFQVVRNPDKLRQFEA